jgi:hypothetical protein
MPVLPSAVEEEATLELALVETMLAARRLF